MAEFIAHNMAPIMFGSLIVFLLLGYPVAFSLGACGLLFFFIGVELAPLAPNYINLDWPLLQSMPERVFGVMNNDVLLAIPFFTFMGLILERSGMAEDLLDTIGQLFGTIRGGLAYAVVFVGALLAATTGVVAASVISMGLISLPIMLRYGYDRRLAAGVIAASGTLAQIIPPSLVLIVLADQLGVDVGSMYQGAFLPGTMLALSYALMVFVWSLIVPGSAPGLPADAVGFRETDRVMANRLSRTNAFLFLCGLMLAAIVAYPALSGAALRGLSSASVGGYAIALLVAIAAVVAIFAVYRLLLTIARGGDERGLMSLLVLVTVSGLVGYLMMARTKYTGADFVILAMSVGTAFSFAVAVLNWVLAKTVGVRFLSVLAQQVTFVMVPPLLLIFLVLGTIFIGLATPTEGGAMGATGAMLLAAAKRFIDRDAKRFNFAITKQAVESTAKLSAFVIFILIGARVFSLTFYGVNGHIWVEEHLRALPGGLYGFLIVINVAVFFLAFFLDFFELAFIVIPLVKPAAQAIFTTDPQALAIAAQFNLTTPEEIGRGLLVWFGIMMAVNMQTSFMHPPFGFSLFFLRSVAPKERYRDKVTGKTMEPVTSGQIYWGAIPFLLMQLAMVALLLWAPGLVIEKKPERPAIDPAKAMEQLQNLAPPPAANDAPPALKF